MGQPGDAAAARAFDRCLRLLKAGDPDANGLLRGLFDHHPSYAAGWQALGIWLLDANKPEAALLCVNRAMTTVRSASLALTAGRALRALGRMAEASQALDEAGRLDPRSARVAFLQGLCAHDLGDLPQARAAYERALALEPDLPEGWTNLGIVLQGEGDLDGAKRAYRAALRSRADTFGRISQALSAAPKGELWLDLGRLRRDLAG